MEEMEILRNNLEELNNSLGGRSLAEVGVIELRRLKGDYEALHELNIELQERLRRTDSVSLSELRNALNLGEEIWEGVRIALSPLEETLRSKVSLVFEKRKQIDRLKDERERNRTLLESTRNQLELTRNAMTRITDSAILESYENSVSLLNTVITNLEELDDNYADQIDRLYAEESVLRLGGTFTDLDEIEALSSGITKEEEAVLTREARRDREEGSDVSEDDSLGEVPIIGSEDLTRGLNLGTETPTEEDDKEESPEDLSPIYAEGTVSGDEEDKKSDEPEFPEFPGEGSAETSEEEKSDEPEFPEFPGEGSAETPEEEKKSDEPEFPEFPGEGSAETSEEEKKSDEPEFPEFPGEGSAETPEEDGHEYGPAFFRGDTPTEGTTSGDEEEKKSDEPEIPEFPGAPAPETSTGTREADLGYPEFPGEAPAAETPTRGPVVVPPADYHVSEEPVRATVTEPKSGLWSKLQALYKVCKIVFLAAIATHLGIGVAYAPGISTVQEQDSEVPNEEPDEPDVPDVEPDVVPDVEPEVEPEETPSEEPEEPSLVPITYDDTPDEPEQPENPEQPKTDEEVLPITLGPNESYVDNSTGVEVSSDGSSYNLKTGTPQKKRDLKKDENGNSIVTTNDVKVDDPKTSGDSSNNITEGEALTTLTGQTKENFEKAVADYNWDEEFEKMSTVR